MASYKHPADFFPTFTVKRKMLIDLDIGQHCVYWAVVTAEYFPNDWNNPVAIYNTKGRKLPHLLARIRAENKLQYLEYVN